MDRVSFSPLPHDLLLQRFITDRPLRKRILYWRAEQGYATAGQSVEPGSDGALRVASGATLSFETYFNSFFEATWRRHTSLGILKLRIEAEGRYEIRVFRRALGRRDVVAQQTAGSGVTELRFTDDALNFRQHGVLSLELTALDGPVVWRNAAWLSEQPAQPALNHAGLGLVFCTFNREADISRVLASIADDPCVLQTLTRITVVNQGRKELSARPEFAGLLRRFGVKLRLIEQDNFGGAGGFTRGLLANLDDPDVTHAVLLDDDIDIEPDSLLRMARFFTLATSDLVLGGHMLDSAQPTQLYEAGAVISERHWDFHPQHHCRDLAHSNSLEPLSHPNAVHYNGWWCCGIPLAALRQVGLPLPCFIRGDDVELGLRLHQQGIETVPLPGVAVWHEPFYLKLGNWQLYYETRNMLIAAALHQPFERHAVARRMTRHLFMHLLTFRYYSAALILRGIGDFLAGPAILHGSPQALHASLGAVRERYPAKATSRGQVLQEQPPTAPPKRRSGFLWLLGVLLLHQWLTPTRNAPVRRLPAQRLTWTVMRGVEHIAVETWWDFDLPTFRRSREDFRSLTGTGLRTMWRLYRHGPRVAAAWQADHPRLVSVDFWKRYLKLAPVAAPIRLPAEIVEAAE